MANSLQGAGLRGPAFLLFPEDDAAEIRPREGSAVGEGSPAGYLPRRRNQRMPLR